MERQFAHLMRLVDDLLDVERLARGKITLRKERVRLGEVVDAAVESGRPMLETHGHTLKISSADPDGYLMADRVRLAQVLSNLLHNASKFTPPGGTIELSAGVEDGQAVVRVRDTGQGISPEILPRIFDYFVQERPSDETQTVRAGLGVGLALARQLVELHGGTIEAASAGPGMGSEFTVRVPLVSEQGAGLQAAQPPTVPQTVLVVDDEHDVADLTVNLLRRAGYQAWVAYDGKTALQVAAEHRPTVALVDLVMPEMDGYEVGRRLRQQYPQMLLIAISGLVQESDRAKATNAGFDHHLAKPTSISQIEELIRQAAAHRERPQ